MNKMNKILLGITAASAMFFATTASAGLIVKVDETTDALAAVVIADNSALDNSALTGLITNTTSTGNFNVVTSTAFGSTLLAWPDLFDLATNVVSSGAGTLEISLTETGFSGFDWAGMSGGGNIATGGAGSFDLYVGSTNGAFEMSHLVATGSFGSGAYSLNAGGNIGPWTTGQFSLTLVTTMVADSAGDFFSTDTKVVPEPSILALIGAGLLGLGLARRKMKK